METWKQNVTDPAEYEDHHEIEKLRPIGSMALLRLENPSKSQLDIVRDDGTSTCLYIPQEFQWRFREYWATVISTGKGARPVKKRDGLMRPVEWHKFEKCPVKPGDRVMVTKWAGRTGSRSTYFGDRYLLVDSFLEILLVEEGAVGSDESSDVIVVDSTAGADCDSPDQKGLETGDATA